MKILKENALFGIVCFSLGLAVMYLGQSVLNHKGYSFRSPLVRTDNRASRLVDDLFDDDFFRKSEKSNMQTKRMGESLMKQFNEDDLESNIFDSLFGSKFGEDSQQITRREDDKFIYYEVLVKDLKQEKLNVKVSEGQINISGQIETKSENGLTESYMTSSFQRSLPVPSNVDANKVQMENEKGKLVIKFPKTV